ncbi:hypothetical protein [Paenibacillus taiwanensis]|uniref:hypothetical protein n=1 Tax=Paenibacillus taiwanensis TaxID=401638 RepID=UPI001FE1136E|nr:hypothetical protein [Paenibacillus taiwanensis]
MVPNPVMASYAFSTIFLFIVSAVISYTLIDIETVNQESVTLLHSGSLLKLYMSKLLYSWLFSIPLALYAILYPAIFHKFDRNPSLEELGMSFIYHITATWLGVALACWFSSKFIRSRVISFLMLSVLIVITLSVQGIKDQLPDALKSVIVLFPPLNSIINVMVDYESTSLFSKLWVAGASLLYGTMIAVLFLLMLHKRKLDSSH